MKSVHAVLPVAALLASGIFLYTQHSGMGSARTEADHLRKTLGMAKALPRKPSSLPPGTGRPGNGSVAELPEETSAGNPKLAFKDLAAASRQAKTRSMPDLRKMLKLQNQMEELSSAEISALLEETASSDLSEAEKVSVQGMLIQNLSLKDPKSAVLAGASLLDDSGAGNRNRGILNSAFNLWGAKDPRAAAVWFDEQLASGKFENKTLSDVNDVRVSFETGLVGTLLLQDPAAAEARLAALTPDERVATLTRGWNIPTTPEAQDAFIRTTRNVLEEKEQAGVVASYAKKIADRGTLEDVSVFLTKSGSDGKERQQVVQQTASGQIVKEVRESGKAPTLESTAAWRTWVRETSNGGASGIIGQSMGEALNSNDFSFDEAASLLPQMVPAADRDEAVASFLDKARWRAKGDSAINLAQSIRDGPLRTRAMENLKNKGTRIPTPIKTK